MTTDQIAAEAAEQIIKETRLPIQRNKEVFAAIIKAAINEYVKLRDSRTSEQNKTVADPNKCDHDELLNFACGDYKCSVCGKDFEVRCDGDEGRCPVCSSHASELLDDWKLPPDSFEKWKERWTWKRH